MNGYKRCLGSKTDRTWIALYWDDSRSRLGILVTQSLEGHGFHLVHFAFLAPQRTKAQGVVPLVTYI